MPTPTSRAILRLSSQGVALGAAAILCGCVVQPLPAPRYVAPPPRPAPVYERPTYVPSDEPVVSVYVDPPLVQPEPIAVAWAPPPMLVEVPPPQPYAAAVWTGGYWAWEGRWFWSAGRWAPPPQPDYGWVQPYYEHRGDVVVFVPGFWCAPQVRFVPPPVGLSITVAIGSPGVHFGPPPMGPQGVFVPPPPGSRAGIIVPAPIGTPPAVVVSAPAVVNVGMRVHGNVDINSHNTVNNVTNITNVTNVTIEAPAGATANGQAFQNSVPARAHLAAAMAPAGRPAAPQPASNQAIPTYVSGHTPMALPAAQPARNGRGGPPNSPIHAAVQPTQGQQPMPQGQVRPELDQPLRQPAPMTGQPQQGQAHQPAQPQPVNEQVSPGATPSGIPAAQTGARHGGKPGTRSDAQPPIQSQQAQAAKPNERKQVKAEKEKADRNKAERERREEGDKKNGDRDR